MSDDTPRDLQPDDETQPVRPGAGAGAGATLPPAPAAGPVADPAPVAATARRGFRERFRTWRTSNDGRRAYSLGALVASALAGVIVGGFGLAAVQAVADDHGDRPGWMERHGPMGRDLGDDDGERGPGFGVPGGPGRLQPTTPPDEDDDSSSSS